MNRVQRAREIVINVEVSKVLDAQDTQTALDGNVVTTESEECEYGHVNEEPDISRGGDGSGCSAG